MNRSPPIIHYTHFPFRLSSSLSTFHLIHNKTLHNFKSILLIPYTTSPDFSDSTSWISTSSQLIILNRHCTFLTSSGIYSLSQLGGNYFALGPPQVVQGIRCWNPNLIKDHPTPSWNVKRDELSEEDDDGDVAVVVEQQRTGSTGGPNNRYVTIQFVGAADANYTISTSLAGYTSLVPGTFLTFLLPPIYLPFGFPHIPLLQLHEIEYPENNKLINLLLQ